MLEILLFSEKCQNIYKTQNLCIFGNLKLSGAGKLGTRATENEFSLNFIFLQKVLKFQLSTKFMHFWAICCGKFLHMCDKK